jgi:Ni/Co efflux regulator RcnB
MTRLAAFTIALTLLGGAAALAQPYDRDRHDENQQSWNRDGDHHDWDRQTFDREWGNRGAEWDHRWNRGDRLPDGYGSDQRYVVRDYGHHRLPRPTRGYHWVRYGNQYVLVRDNGYVGRTVYNWRY